MKNCLFTLAAAGFAATPVVAQDGLYSVGIEDQDSVPLTWSAGLFAIYDDNVTAGTGGTEEDSLALNPFVGVSFVNVQPQTTIDLYARLGVIHYFDTPLGIDDLNSQSRVGLDITHNVNERVRLVSRNFISYELEPDYARGYASARTAGEFLFWSTDNSVGYRWSERLGTYTGIMFSGATFAELDQNDRMDATLYHQFRYQLTPITVGTLDYRYSFIVGDGGSSSSDQQFILLGVEHRFNPNTIGILRGGAQFRMVNDTGSNLESPYMEAALRTQVNEQFAIHGFARYGMEYWDTVQFVDVDADGFLDPVEFDDRRTFRIGVTGEYILSPKVSLFGGVDFIPTDFSDGRIIKDGPNFTRTPIPPPDLNESVISLDIGMNFRITDNLVATVAYTHTTSDSDLINRDYDRNRVSAGITAQF